MSAGSGNGKEQGKSAACDSRLVLPVIAKNVGCQRHASFLWIDARRREWRCAFWRRVPGRIWLLRTIIVLREWMGVGQWGIYKWIYFNLMHKMHIITYLFKWFLLFGDWQVILRWFFPHCREFVVIKDIVDVDLLSNRTRKNILLFPQRDSWAEYVKII